MISPGWKALAFVFTTIASFVITFIMGVFLMLGIGPYAPDSIFFGIPAIVAALCAAIWAWLIIPFILRSRKADKNFREQN
jgi:CBS domain containing-hemolysin-like protein